MKIINSIKKTKKSKEFDFKVKLKSACYKAANYIDSWLRGNGIICMELQYDWDILSENRNFIKCNARAIDTYNDRVHIFQWTCRGIDFEICYSGMSQRPDMYKKGDFTLELYSNNDW